MSGALNSAIGAGMQERVRAELSAIEVGHGVTIPLAIESGSRAWGFPSQDSDYDVRFIYLRPVGDYLTVTTRRDVIERPVDAGLDLNGWDVRKALQLALRSNAVLLEWLSSPVRYLSIGPVPGQLLSLTQTTAELAALDYHYDHLARRSFAEIVSGGGNARFKTYCYALRAALALYWLRDRRAVPPMDLPSLLTGVDMPADTNGEIARLVDRKARATEQDTTSRIAVIDDHISRILAKPAIKANRVCRSDARARADALFASIVLGQQNQRQ